MIKFHVSNMSCGSCRLKVKAELEKNGYEAIDIDVNDGLVTVEDQVHDTNKIINILHDIKYVVDQDSIEEFIERRIWIDEFMDDAIVEKFMRFLDNNQIELSGFDEEDFHFIVLVSEKNQVKLEMFLETLKR